MKIDTEKRKIKAFTLIELLIVITIISILGSAVTIVLNPAELLAESRDGERVADIESIVRAVNLARADNTGLALGDVNTVYISIPYVDTDCDYPTVNSLGLPTLPAGWTYRCSSDANYRKTNGSGWLPVDLTSISTGVLLPVLPIDPVNSVAENSFYAYYPGSEVFEVNARMESEKYSLAGSVDRVSSDGGDDFTRLEKGTDLSLAPWSFEFKYLPISSANTKKPGWYITQTGSVSLGTESGDTTYARSSGYTWSTWQENIPFSPNATYKITVKLRQVVEPTVGGKNIYVGWSGIRADGLTAVAPDGSTCCQHYHAVAGSTLVAGAGWSTFTGYTKGLGAVTGDWGPCSTPASPCKMNPAVRFLRPIYALNYAAGSNGVADIDYIRIEKQ